MSDPFSEDAQFRRARRNRNLMLGAALVAFVVLVFIVTIVRLSGNVAH